METHIAAAKAAGLDYRATFVNLPVEKSSPTQSFPTTVDERILASVEAVTEGTPGVSHKRSMNC
jgi:hypothetical protein